MTTKQPPIKARLTLPTQRAMWLSAQFMAGEFIVLKISPPMPTRHDANTSNVYFDLEIEEHHG